MNEGASQEASASMNGPTLRLGTYHHPALESGTPNGGNVYGSGNGNGRMHGESGSAQVSTTHLRSVLGRFATGVVAITAVEGKSGRPYGLAANSFTSVSLEPPLVAFCVAHSSTSWPRIKEAGRYCVNILAEHQQPLCAQLARSGGDGFDKFAGLTWTRSPSGGPVLDGALAWIDCETESEHLAGDHVIVVSRVLALDRHHGTEPLIFFEGGYRSLDGPSLGGGGSGGSGLSSGGSLGGG